MRDPYEVLGVTRDATDAQIKQAYRDLAKKYHPDNYADDNLAEIAQEKMKEINEAYDTICNERSGKSGYGNHSSGASGVYYEIRNMISQNRLDDALRKLDDIPLSQRNAEWHFLSGSVQYKRGWFDNAYTNFAIACQMEPNNAEYRAAYNNIQAQRSGYNPYRTSRGNECNTCDICAGLYAADCCCECLGGDLIRCC